MSTPPKLILRARRFARRHIVPQAASRLWYRKHAVQYLQSLTPDYDPAKKTILAINHYYDQDLRALRYASEKYNFIVVDAPMLFKGVKVYLSPDVIALRAPYNSEPLHRRLRYRDECRFFFDLLRRRFDPRLIITANDNFAFIREFIYVARESNVPTVIIDKEGTISPHAFRSHAAKLRRFAPCISDHVFVWSQRQKAFWQKIGVAETNISVIGQPRSDLFYRERSIDLDRYFAQAQPLVTCFSYEDTAYVPPDMVKRGVTLAKMKREMHALVADLARRYPQHNFVIKTHPQQSDGEDLRRKFHGPNLTVIGGADSANELIMRSELIIVFQTTAAMEAMFMNKPVIYTAWDDNYRSLKNDMLPLHRAPGIVVADTYDRFRTVSERFLRGNQADFEFSNDELHARSEFVNNYMYKPDGHVCERFFKRVETFLA